MNRNSEYIKIGRQQLHYVSTGKGKKALLAFHGYGNDANLLLPITNYLGDEYTIFSIDLPHHGNSGWPADKWLDCKDLDTIIDHFKIKHSVTQLSLLGYSMGGRVCIKMIEQMPASIDKVVLMASDGLRFNSLYHFVTRSTPGKYLFQSFLTNPDKYLPLIGWAKKRGWISEARYKFALRYISAEQDRKFLLKVWPAMAYIIPDYTKVNKAVQAHKIEIHLFMGAFDSIIPVALAHEFCKKVHGVQLHIMQKGHRVFDVDTIPQIAQTFLA